MNGTYPENRTRQREYCNMSELPNAIIHVYLSRRYSRQSSMCHSNCDPALVEVHGVGKLLRVQMTARLTVQVLFDVLKKKSNFPRTF